MPGCCSKMSLESRSCSSTCAHSDAVAPASWSFLGCSLQHHLLNLRNDQRRCCVHSPFTDEMGRGEGFALGPLLENPRGVRSLNLASFRPEVGQEAEAQTGGGVSSWGSKAQGCQPASPGRRQGGRRRPDGAFLQTAETRFPSASLFSGLLDWVASSLLEGHPA